MLNNYIQLAGILNQSSYAEVLLFRIAIVVCAIWLFSMPISLIPNIIAIFKHKKHPRKKLKIYLIAKILTLITHTSYILLFVISSTMTNQALLQLLILIITEAILLKWYSSNEKNKKKQLIIQTLSTIIPFIVAIIVSILIQMF